MKSKKTKFLNQKKEKALVEKLQKSSGRNNRGVITCRHKGGGHKQLYRRIDFNRNKIGVKANVVRIDYDPNRNVDIALLHYIDGEKRYILAPKGLEIGSFVESGAEVEVKVGNALPLENIPLGSEVHNIELYPKKGGQIVRSAGLSARILAKEKNYVILRLPSKEIRLVSKNCYATVGTLGNGDVINKKIKKAGQNRWLGKRPTVRGVVMNPCDHPHGGGEGKSPIGRKRPVTPWGKGALGIKTRKKKNPTNIFIFRSRKG